MLSLSVHRHFFVIRAKWNRALRPLIFFLILLSVVLAASFASAENTYHLVGTVESKGFSGAIIIAPDGTQAFYRLREILPDGAQLIEVRSDTILVKSPDGSRYEMFISSTAGKLQSPSSPVAPASAPPQARTSPDQDKQSRSSRSGSRRSSAGEE